MTAKEIRRSFLDFFQERGHTFVPSSPVVPLNDPTLLFANAGMNQFKDIFLGKANAAYNRAVNSQKCIRAGGKHNDLEDVGQDTYHHTFFEMLGTWSFGDYFKRDAIRWAWELLHGVYGIPAERLHATYFEGNEAEGVPADLEARDLWIAETGILPQNVHPFGKADNFWEMGEVGPCGPCTEIHVDRTPDLSGHGLVNASDPRVMEVWNLVFIQYNRDASGKLTLLPAQHVDTGMGFERLVAVLQGQNSNYDTDVFSPLIAAIARQTGAPAYRGTLPSATPTQDELRDVSYRVVADHIRTLSFAIADGALPDNNKRGSVLRRILRRAHRYGRQFLKAEGPFLFNLVSDLVEQMGDEFPELRDRHDLIVEVIRDEEISFSRTLTKGQKLFEERAQEAAASRLISGEVAFKLHDTYGFPIDLTALMAKERGFSVDIAEYERLKKKAKDIAGAGGRSKDLDAAVALAAATTQNDKNFFERTRTDDRAKFKRRQLTATLIGWLDGDGRLQDRELENDDLAALLTTSTCFYAEQGGQVGDRGVIRGDGATFEVIDTQRLQDTVLHLGRLTSGRFLAGQEVDLEVDGLRRTQIEQHHSATHLLNLALRNVLGAEVHQRGSLVDDKKTRFDFSHRQTPSAAELQAIEAQVGSQIAAGLVVDDREVALPDAQAIQGLRAIFGEKYPERVRVVAIGASVAEALADPQNPRWQNFSFELCGGTHVASSAQIDRFVLIGEEGIAKGVRRVVGVAGAMAQEAFETAATCRARLNALRTSDNSDELNALTRELPLMTLAIVDRAEIQAGLDALHVERRKRLELAEKSQDSETLARAETLLATAHKVANSSIIVGSLEAASPEQLRQAADWLRQKSGSAAVLLFATGSERSSMLAAVTPDLLDRLDARTLLREAGSLVGGGGGGRSDLAQGSAKDPAKIPAALATLRSSVADQLKQ